MNTLRPSDRRFDIYRREVRDAFEHDNTYQAEYYLANLALEEMKATTELGVEPDDARISEIEYRFDRASDSSADVDELVSLRSRLIRAWIRPIVWAGILNLDGLTNAEAKHAAAMLELPTAIDETANLVHMALTMYDESSKIPLEDRTKRQSDRTMRLSGFLNETTPVQLAGRHASAKMLVLPSLAYDDGLNPVNSQRIDGYLLDNRRKRAESTVYPFQVGTLSEHSHVSQLIPVLSPRLMGNIRSSSHWANDDRTFGTARRLVTERRVHRLSKDATRNLDRISSSVMNTIMQTPQ